ncbi:hypothetical protein KVT40_001405 [Elsinoe batatas]|uniref:T6SS Phospholipase effector Tle1-like catalytic domain-containing protein n=1 Tax=Elsinoe batatas TaxID=2601811 RepID=A0A8K0L4M2_9PEZI|nr:hypothetical protein KVT40_001405 [Elsinoe batatas]
MPSFDQLSEPSKMKRIIICCDGTWQSSNHGLEGVVPSNVAKISRAISKYEETSNGQIIHQIVYYDAGVGTGTDVSGEGKQSWTAWANSYIAAGVRRWEGGLGAGLDENVNEAYNFIVNNYNKGDELYFFGFSRGAFTARAVAGLVASVGICTNLMMDDYPAMYAAYKSRPKDKDIDDTVWAKEPPKPNPQNKPAGSEWLARCVDRDPTIKVVGVFDTVGALGLPDTVHLRFNSLREHFGFHNTDLLPEVENGFHALALDEHRRSFSPTLWSLTDKPVKDHPGHPKREDRPKQRLVQCWFPGMHINIGGGSSDVANEAKAKQTDMEAMANITYAWMVDRVRESTRLCFDWQALGKIAEAYNKSVHASNGTYTPSGWDLGPISDPWKKMWLGGSLDRTPGEYHDTRVTEEYIHPIVEYALRSKKYPLQKDHSLKDFKRVKRSDGDGYEWRKTIGGKTVSIKEFVIPGDKEDLPRIERWVMMNGTQQGFQGLQPSWEKVKAQERDGFMETASFINELDKANGIKLAEPRFSDSSAKFTQTGFR